MSTFPNSPKLLKGGIVLVDPDTAAVRRIISLQYFPDTVTRSLQIQGITADSGGEGDRSELLRLKGPPVETNKLIATQFGLTKPPKLPIDDDRFAVAGIVDRYETINNVVRKDLDVQRDPKAKTTTWSKGPGNSIRLGDDFFALKTTIERTRCIMTALVGQVSTILPAHRKKFVDLAEQINARNPLP